MCKLTTKDIYRFAPSPNGNLHLGHALSAILNYELAHKTNGTFLLRIEDIDQTRCTPTFEQNIYEDLMWLELNWPTPVRRQSDHFEAYHQALNELQKKDLIYPAFMTRREIKAYFNSQTEPNSEIPTDPDGVPLYPALDKHLSNAARHEAIASGRPYAWRLNMDMALKDTPLDLHWCEQGDGVRGSILATPHKWGDVILSRSDLPSSYHLSVTVDDAIQDISHVVRGMDLFQATSIHRILQHLLDLPAPIYHHHRLISDTDGRKLSKSKGSTSIRSMRQKGYSPLDIRAIINM